MLRFSTAGESHGEALVAVLSGVPAGLKIDSALIDRELWRRQQGYGRGGRMKIERDTAHILSGVRHGATIGSPIALTIENRDWKNWQEALPVGAGDPEKHKAVNSPAARPRRSCRRAQIQFPRSPLRAGARFGAGIGSARRRRGYRQAAAAGVRHRGAQPRPRGGWRRGAAMPKSPGRRSRRFTPARKCC